MNRFALVGKDISHSRSPEMYRKLISQDIMYDLLDYCNESEIPSAAKLLNQYDGINITSPYKKHFIAQVELSAIAKEIGAINCLKMREGRLFGENTDYFSVFEILKEMQNKYGAMDVVILGDGVMSNVTKIALVNLNLKHKVFSRKKDKHFSQLNLDNYFNESKALPLVINTCARSFVFKGKLPSTAIFWDFNYNFDQHLASIPCKVYKYIDGLEMLERQAFFAISFWSK